MIVTAYRTAKQGRRDAEDVLTLYPGDCAGMLGSIAARFGTAGFSDLHSAAYRRAFFDTLATAYGR